MILSAPILLYIILGLYFVAMLLQFFGAAFKKDVLKTGALVLLMAAWAVHTVYTILRGVEAQRVPLATQFEFANAFAWGVALLGICFRLFSKAKMDWMLTLCCPLSFLILSYALLVYKEVGETMPALKSAWFTLHIGSAVFSYAAFAIAAALSIRYLVLEKRFGFGLSTGKGKTDLSDEKQDETKLAVLKQTDKLSYKLICFGMLLLSVVIISGCIWAEQAWGIFWSWDPKETWALITWVIYAVYLHQRLNMKWRGRKTAWFAIFAFILVIFTFAGVNTLLSGLHSYA